MCTDITALLFFTVSFLITGVVTDKTLVFVLTKKVSELNCLLHYLCFPFPWVPSPSRNEEFGRGPSSVDVKQTDRQTKRIFTTYSLALFCQKSATQKQFCSCMSQVTAAAAQCLSHRSSLGRRNISNFNHATFYLEFSIFPITFWIPISCSLGSIRPFCRWPRSFQSCPLAPCGLHIPGK